MHSPKRTGTLLAETHLSDGNKISIHWWKSSSGALETTPISILLIALTASFLPKLRNPDEKDKWYVDLEARASLFSLRSYQERITGFWKAEGSDVQTQG